MKNFVLSLTMMIIFMAGFETRIHACEAYFSLGLSELSFTDDGKWELEIYFELLIPTCEKRGMGQDSSAISLDSAFLSSAAGREKLKFTDYFLSSPYSIITADSLLHELTIDSQGDSLCLISYFNYYGEVKTGKSLLIFGDHQGSHLSRLKPGQSYIHIGDGKFCKTNIPTLGRMNNANLGTYAFLKGRIYDKDNIPLKGDISGLGDNRFYYNFWLTIDSLGNYISTVYSRIDTIYRLTYFDQGTHASMINIIPVPYNLDPDSVLFTDIHLLGVLISSHKSIEKDVGIDFYPNPVKEKITFRINRKINGNILIMSLNGEIVHDLPVKDQEVVTWQIPRQLENGIYFFKIFSSGNITREGKFVLLK